MANDLKRLNALSAKCEDTYLFKMTKMECMQVENLTLR